MKANKLISKNQSQNWFSQITQECLGEYPINFITGEFYNFLGEEKQTKLFN